MTSLQLDPENLRLGKRVLTLRLRRSKRAKRLILRLAPGEEALILTLPPGVSREQGVAFVQRQEDWIEQRLA